MAFGVIEGAVIIGITVIAIAIFGRKAFKELLRTFFGAKKDLEDVKKEFPAK